MAGAVSYRWELIADGRAGPGPRSRHCLAYDPVARATVLFGGILWDALGALRSDTWELRGGRWSRVRCEERPPARHRGAMAYDARRGYSVLFGGQGDDGGLFRDTWTYADGRWRKWRAEGEARPPRRCGHCMTFDEAAGAVVLFGGLDERDRPLGDTWRFDGDVWRRVRGLGPAPRRYAAFAYDPNRKGCVLHGGAEDDRGYFLFGDAWLLRDGGWARMASGFTTGGRDDHGMAFHRAARRLVLLEGLAGERGILVEGLHAWQAAEVQPLHPRHQCSPLAWDNELDGLVMHGGEVRHGGPQFDHTWVLRLSAP